MKYAAIQENDYINGEGICVSFWVQGCPHRCEGCHNPSQWDFEEGLELPTDYKGQIVKAISANGITRNFSILGGEPLCAENIDLTLDIVTAVRSAYPNIKIFVWTGYVLENFTHPLLKELLNKIDVLIDGPFIQSQRDVTLKLRGSTNQRILQKGIDF
jgi:anaerobic ribonucleoside-triphosphate reductase activating protein